MGKKNRKFEVKAPSFGGGWGRPLYQKELLGLTGYIRGGCSPLGMKKPYPIFIDESCLLFNPIYISAGQRGLQLKNNPDDLITVVGAVVGDLAE